MTLKREGLDTLLKKLPSKGRFRFFLLFVFLSFTFWLSTKLSNTYTIVQTFPVVLTDVPQGIVLHDTSHKMSASITASGLEILLYRLIDKTVIVSLNESKFRASLGSVSLRNQQFSIAEQLFDNTVLNQIYPESLEIAYSRLDEKVVSVVPQTQITLRAGYLGDIALKSEPDSVLVRGPKSILDTLFSVTTTFYQASDVHESISQEVVLKSIPELELDPPAVSLILPVSRYSEKEFSIQIEVLNLPVGVRVKLFPSTAKIRAIIPMTLLSTVKESDFRLVVDYETLRSQENKSLKLKILKQPPGLKQLLWEPQEVNYLIRK